MANSNRILVKLLPTVALAATNSRANLRPLHDEVPPNSALGLTSAPACYLAELPDQTGPTPGTWPMRKWRTNWASMNPQSCLPNQICRNIFLKALRLIVSAGRSLRLRIVLRWTRMRLTRK